MIEKDIKQRFLQAFDKIAGERQINQKDLSKVFGFSSSYASQLRSRPEARITATHLAIMVTKFNVDPYWLLTGETKSEKKDDYTEIIRRLNNIDYNVEEVVKKLLEGLMDGKVVDKMTLKKWIKSKN